MKILATEQSGTAIGAAPLQRALVALAGGAHARSAKGWRAWWTVNRVRPVATTP